MDDDAEYRCYLFHVNGRSNSLHFHTSKNLKILGTWKEILINRTHGLESHASKVIEDCYIR